MNLSEKMQRCVAIMDERDEDNEFVVRYVDIPGWTNTHTGVVTPRETYWEAELSNQVRSVRLGESDGIYSTRGATPDEAVDAMLNLLSPAK